VFLSSPAFAIDPPDNIRMNGGDLTWDAVEGAAEYHIYYFEEPVPSVTNLGKYVRHTGGTRWPLDSFGDPFGYYTVVSIRWDEQFQPVEVSPFTENALAAYLDPSNNSPVSNGSLSIVVNELRCDNMVAGSVCAATCATPAIPTGGACRADAGVTLHQRAMVDSYQCLAQQDTSFVEVDVYCLNGL